MTTSVGMKAGKKQSPVSEFDKQLEQTLLSLESVCFNVMESRFASSRDDIDGLMLQRKFKNIVTPVSLALAECKGPRHFHNHYRHKEDDDSVLTPVLAEPLGLLAQACESALKQCQIDLVGIASPAVRKKARSFENALRSFVHGYEEYLSEKA